jgi:hypothetical protein
LSADKINAGTLGVDRIPNLSADKINAGTLGVDRIPNLSADKINAGTLGVDRIPNLSASKITSGTIAGNLTVTGAITPSVGNTETTGIMFPKNPGGGGDDAAWMRYYVRSGTTESCTLEIGISNDTDDTLSLVGPKITFSGNLTVNDNLQVVGEIQGKIWFSTEYTWTAGQSQVKMGDSKKCVAFLTYVQGKFSGGGEQVYVYIGSDGYWYLTGAQGSGGAGIVAKARCIGVPF